MNRFIKLLPTFKLFDLLEHHPKAFLLLTLIAARARMIEDDPESGLKVGQALIGDPRKCGLSAKEYRTAKEVLQKGELVVFQGTSKGTIATLCNTSIYDISCKQKGEQKGEQNVNKRATNKIDNKIDNKNIPDFSDEKSSSPLKRKIQNPEDIELAKLLSDLMTNNNPERKPSSEKQIWDWADNVRLMRERDNRNYETIRKVINFSQSDKFWLGVINSMGTLREKFDTLNLQMKNKTTPQQDETANWQTETLPDGRICPINPNLTRKTLNLGTANA